MKKSKFKNGYFVKLILPLYDIPYFIFVGDTMKKACKGFDKTFKGFNLSKNPNVFNSAGYAIRIYDYNNNPTFCLLFSKKSFKHISKQGIIAHESLHLINFISEYLGIKMDYTNDEPFAYMIEEVVLNINKIIK